MAFVEGNITSDEFINKTEYLIKLYRNGTLSKDEFFLLLAAVDNSVNMGDSHVPGDYRLDLLFSRLDDSSAT